MREIRFRAWNTKEKKFYDDIFGIDDSSQIVLIEQPHIMATPEYIVAPNCIPLQFTGRKDFNGTDVFEGDILQSSDFPLRSIGVVKFGEFSDDWGHKNIGFYFDDAGKNKLDRLRPDLIFWVEEGAVVVGNIFENPELVENGEVKNE